MTPGSSFAEPRRICVFSGSSAGISDAYAGAARALGEQLAQSGIDLVYGGASVGLMGAVADAVLAAGGQVIGVIPRALVDKEVAHLGLTDLAGTKCDRSPRPFSCQLRMKVSISLLITSAWVAAMPCG